MHVVKQPARAFVLFSDLLCTSQKNRVSRGSFARGVTDFIGNHFQKAVAEPFPRFGSSKAALQCGAVKELQLSRFEDGLANMLNMSIYDVGECWGMLGTCLSWYSKHYECICTYAQEI